MAFSSRVGLQATFDSDEGLDPYYHQIEQMMFKLADLKGVASSDNEKLKQFRSIITAVSSAKNAVDDYITRAQGEFVPSKDRLKEAIQDWISIECARLFFSLFFPPTVGTDGTPCLIDPRNVRTALATLLDMAQDEKLIEQVTWQALIKKCSGETSLLSTIGRQIIVKLALKRQDTRLIDKDKEIFKVSEWDKIPLCTNEYLPLDNFLDHSSIIPPLGYEKFYAEVQKQEKKDNEEKRDNEKMQRIIPEPKIEPTEPTEPTIEATGSLVMKPEIVAASNREDEVEIKAEELKENLQMRVAPSQEPLPAPVPPPRKRPPAVHVIDDSIAYAPSGIWEEAFDATFKKGVSQLFLQYYLNFPEWKSDASNFIKAIRFFGGTCAFLTMPFTLIINTFIRLPFEMIPKAAEIWLNRKPKKDKWFFENVIYGLGLLSSFFRYLFSFNPVRAYQECSDESSRSVTFFKLFLSDTSAKRAGGLLGVFLSLAGMTAIAIFGPFVFASSMGAVSSSAATAVTNGFILLDKTLTISSVGIGAGKTVGTSIATAVVAGTTVASSSTKKIYQNMTPPPAPPPSPSFSRTPRPEEDSALVDGFEWVSSFSAKSTERASRDSVRGSAPLLAKKR